NSKISNLEEPVAFFSSGKVMPITKDFNYKEFKKISDKVPFTQKEWADILHISERTLQRYAKDEGNFNFSVADRILQIDKVIKKGIEVFGSIEKFIGWLKSNPYMLEGRLSLQSLGSFDGITMVLTQLGRIEHGLFA
ncbi:MAG: antitoxin Xre-like helix-turn-helix domain-containing protein, partial [Ginsengibacter sp.]